MGFLSGLRFGSAAAEGGAAPNAVSGLRKMRPDDASAAPAAKVGDGGVTFRAAALRRATEDANTTGRTLEEVVAERWGSLEELLGDDAEAVRAAARRPAGPGRSRALKGVKKFDRENDMRKRRVDDDDEARAKNTLPVGRDASDADVLRKYSKKLESALEGFAKGEDPSEPERRRPEEGDDAGGDDDRKWVGLNKHTSLGMHTNMDDLFARKRRREQGEKHDAPQADQHRRLPPRRGDDEIKGPPPSAAPQKGPPRGLATTVRDDDSWAAAVKARDGAPVRTAPAADVATARQAGSGNTDIAAMLRAKLGNSIGGGGGGPADI